MQMQMQMQMHMQMQIPGGSWIKTMTQLFGFQAARTWGLGGGVGLCACLCPVAA